MFENIPVFLAGLMLRLSVVLVMQQEFQAGRSHLSRWNVCRWDRFGIFFPLMQISLINVFMLWPIPSGALTPWQFRGTPTWQSLSVLWLK